MNESEAIRDEAAALVVDMDHPTPEIWARVAHFCARSELHKQTYEAIQRSSDRATLAMRINLVRQ